MDEEPKPNVPVVEALEVEQNQEQKLDLKLLLTFSAQHLSSSWNYRCYEFAVFLFLIEIFPDSLLKPSIYGFVTTGSAVLFSGSVGEIVHSTRRLKLIRNLIITQKTALAVAYALLLLSFRAAGTWQFPLLILSGIVLKLSTIGINVSIERDWVTIIAEGNGDHLTQLNTYLRRIDLITALVGPLFVSLLATAASSIFATAFLLGFSLFTMIFEFWWIQIVYKISPSLKLEEDLRYSKMVESPVSKKFSLNPLPSLRQLQVDYVDFVQSPVFLSSLAISLLYLTVLSFDGTLLAYLISHGWSAAVLAGIRGANVVMGLLGTVVMPFLEKRVGLIRTGSWSIITEVLFLLPVLLSFFINPPPLGEIGSPLNACLLFIGMGLSRISLWCFDLVQLKILQVGLQNHPRRNALTALQYSLANSLDLLKYVLTIVLSDPAKFKYAALVSWIAVLSGAVCYLAYVRKERGHLLHFDNLLKKHI